MVKDTDDGIKVLLVAMVEPTVMMPVWIMDNEPGDTFIRCLLGSEPTSAARAEEVPRAAINGRPTTIPQQGMMIPPHLSHLRGLVFAVLNIHMGKLPPDMIDRIYQGVSRAHDNPSDT